MSITSRPSNLIIIECCEYNRNIFNANFIPLKLLLLSLLSVDYQRFAALEAVKITHFVSDASIINYHNNNLKVKTICNETYKAGAGICSNTIASRRATVVAHEKAHLMQADHSMRQVLGVPCCHRLKGLSWRFAQLVNTVHIVFSFFSTRENSTELSH